MGQPAAGVVTVTSVDGRPVARTKAEETFGYTVSDLAAGWVQAGARLRRRTHRGVPLQSLIVRLLDSYGPIGGVTGWDCGDAPCAVLAQGGEHGLVPKGAGTAAATAHLPPSRTGSTACTWSPTRCWLSPARTRRLAARRPCSPWATSPGTADARPASGWARTAMTTHRPTSGPRSSACWRRPACLRT
jgi:hypothetical protein